MLIIAGTPPGLNRLDPQQIEPALRAGYGAGLNPGPEDQQLLGLDDSITRGSAPRRDHAAHSLATAFEQILQQRNDLARDFCLRLNNPRARRSSLNAASSTVTSPPGHSIHRQQRRSVIQHHASSASSSVEMLSWVIVPVAFLLGSFRTRPGIRQRCGARTQSDVATRACPRARVKRRKNG